MRACCASRACPSASSPVSQFYPRNHMFFSVHVDPKKITKRKGQYKQKMTNVTELSSKHQSLGREFGCVLALDGLRSDIQRKHWLGHLNLSWQAKRPRACEPTCTRPKVSPAKTRLEEFHYQIRTASALIHIRFPEIKNKRTMLFKKISVKRLGLHSTK